MSGLRVINADGNQPLSLPDLQQQGNRLIREAKDAAAEALVASIQREFLIEGRHYNLHQVKHLQVKARAAAQAWAKVDGLLSELLLDVQASKGGAR